MEIYPRNFKFARDASAQALLNYAKERASTLELDDAVIFCEFPLYREDSEVYLSKLLIVSPVHGVLILGSFSGNYNQDGEGLLLAASQTEAVFSHVYSKLVKSPQLRSTRTNLMFEVDVAMFCQEAPADANVEGEMRLLRSFAEFDSFLSQLARTTPLGAPVVAEVLSIVEGSKGLIRPRERRVADFAPTSKVALVKALEEEIRRFDREQRIGYMTDVYSPQRITGLAGSGKTVVLAMKAALAHLKNPEAKIAFTFYTKSLYQHVKQLITRFYRQFDDRDPDWENLRILHAWGGSINEGLYHFAARAMGEMPITFGLAKAHNPRQPFDFVCKKLLDSSKVRPLFDYIFVDEAQDFPPSFLRLALGLAHEEKLVIAYDVFQTIFDVEIPTAETLFGTNASGEPAVSFEEDIVLHKCYRNPLEILVCAHAIGFGLYSNIIVQMLESADHWNDFGYRLESGELTSGHRVKFLRPPENSPSSISSSSSASGLIEVNAFGSIEEEVGYVASQIVLDVRNEGLMPEDLLVICADDKNTRGYQRLIAAELRKQQLTINNLQDNDFGLKDFFQRGEVTFSSIYKAKGNEAVVVFVVGVDALFHFPNARNRNTIFTAMTRAKGWLRVSGLGLAAERFKTEVETAKQNLPYLEFTYPEPGQLIKIRRDLSDESVLRMESMLDDLEQQLAPDELEAMLVNKLREVRRKKRSFGTPKTRRKTLS